MAGELSGRRIAFLATDGVEQAELTKPWDAIKSAGAEVELISLETGKVRGYNHLDEGDAFKVDKTVSEASSGDYDGLVLPGGVANPDALRMNDDAVKFTRGFFDAGLPVAAICHAPWMLIEAGVVEGKKVTSWPSLQTDLRNAGAKWADEEVIVDEGLVTSRKPDDLPAFIEKAIEEFGEGKH